MKLILIISILKVLHFLSLVSIRLYFTNAKLCKSIARTDAHRRRIVIGFGEGIEGGRMEFRIK